MEILKLRKSSLCLMLGFDNENCKINITDSGRQVRCVATQSGSRWVCPAWIRMLSTKRSEHKAIIREDVSNPRTTGSLGERRHPQVVQPSTPAPPPRLSPTVASSVKPPSQLLQPTSDPQSHFQAKPVAPALLY